MKKCLLQAKRALVCLLHIQISLQRQAAGPLPSLARLLSSPGFYAKVNETRREQQHFLGLERGKGTAAAREGGKGSSFSLVRCRARARVFCPYPHPRCHSLGKGGSQKKFSYWFLHARELLRSPLGLHRIVF